MKNRSTDFNDASKIEAAEQVQKHAQAIQSNARTFAMSVIKEATGLDDICIHSHSMVKLGNIKTLEALIRKGDNAHNGDLTKVADVCRLRILTRDAAEAEKVITLFNREHKHASSKFDPNEHRNDHFKCSPKVRFLSQENEDHQQELVDFKDHISKPKKWGWMGSIAKLEVKAGKSCFHVPFEIQVYPRDMDKAYDQSHKLYSQIKSDVEDWERYCEIHDNLGNDPSKIEKAITENPNFFNPRYKEFQTGGKTGISTFFRKIRNEAPYNVTKTHNAHVIETLQEIIQLHHNAAKQVGLLDCKLFKQSKHDFPQLQDADARDKEFEAEPIEGYATMQQNILLEQTLGPELVQQLSEESGYMQDDIVELALQIQEAQGHQQTNTPSNE